MSGTVLAAHAMVGTLITFHSFQADSAHCLVVRPFVVVACCWPCRPRSGRRRRAVADVRRDVQGAAARVVAVAVLALLGLLLEVAVGARLVGEENGGHVGPVPVRPRRIHGSPPSRRGLSVLGLARFGLPSRNSRTEKKIVQK